MVKIRKPTKGIPKPHKGPPPRTSTCEVCHEPFGHWRLVAQVCQGESCQKEMRRRRNAGRYKGMTVDEKRAFLRKKNEKYRIQLKERLGFQTINEVITAKCPLCEEDFRHVCEGRSLHKVKPRIHCERCKRLISQRQYGEAYNVRATSVLQNYY